MLSADTKYTSISDSKTTTSNTLNTELLQHPTPSTLQQILFGNGEEGTVSTLGSREN